MEFSINQIAYMLGGEVEGDGELKINKLEKIQDATAGCIAFLDNQKYEPFIYTTHASAVIVKNDFVPKSALRTALIKVEDPRASFSVLLEEYYKVISFLKNGVEQPCFVGSGTTVGANEYRGAFSYIGEHCEIGRNVKIYPQVYIGDRVTIGNNTIIHSGVKIYSDTVIGSHCIIHAGTVIGSDGFGYVPLADGSYKAVPQVGNVILENHVHIGSNTVIDCATMGSTIIREGVKLDNLIQVAHNAEVGKHTVIASQSGVSGSTKVGAFCVVGGQVGFAGHLDIADRTSIGAQSGLSKSVKHQGTAISGTPAFDLKDNLKSYVVYKKLPEMLKRIEEIEKRMLESVNK